MNNRKLATNVISGLLALVGAVMLMQYLLAPKDDESISQRDDSATPEWYWITAHYWHFNEKGEISQDATATDVKYYNVQDIAYLNDPRITSHGGNDSPWFSRADFGQMREDNNVIELYQDVRITRGDNEVVIETERLIIKRDEKVAETDQPISIESGNSRTDGVGMRAWFDQEKVELLDNVRTVHDPK